ncbi:MAG: membrane dipeptidase [Bacteroidales bacterium]|nr:membrane dipeptidase [Bacteroidales bacterium]
MRRVFSLLAVALLIACSLDAQSGEHCGKCKKSGALNLTDTEYMALADSIHKVAISFDTHVDTPTYMMDPDGHYTVAKGQVSFEQMRRGGQDGAFFAIYLDQGPWQNQKSLDSAYNWCHSELQFWKDYVTNYCSSEAGIAYSTDDVYRLKKEGKRIVVLCIENGYPVRTLEDVDEFASMGVKYITLSHNTPNQICDGSRYVKSYYWYPSTGHGLSQFGEKVVERMQQKGIMVDVSHISSEALADVLRVAKAPVFASHSACRALKPSQTRNLTDDEIRAIAAVDGVIQVGTGRFFLSDDLPYYKVGVAVLANHIDHIKNLVGYRHVGLGTDFDGGGGVVGLDNSAQMKNLTVELLKRGWTADELIAFWGGNLLRVWKACEAYASQFK